MNASASTSVLDAPRSMVQAPSIAPAATKHDASTSVKGYATPSTVVRKTKKPSGAGAKRLPGPLKSSRLCADESCKTVLTPGWRWRRCQTCRGGGVKRTVIVSCASCTTAVTVSASQANTGEPTFCTLCRQRTLAAQAGIMLPQPPPFLVMGPPMGRPSGQHTRKLVPMVGTPVKQSSLLEEAMAFIHPDHRRAIRARNGAPDPNFPLQSPAPAYTPLVRDASTIAPHYGPRGEILAVLPTFLSQSPATGAHTTTWPLVPLQSGRTRADSIVIPDSSDNPFSAQSTDKGPNPVTITLVEADSSNSKGFSSSNPAPHPPVSASDLAALNATLRKKKRRRTLAPKAPGPPQERICASSSCGRALSPQDQGFFCPDCGFLLWRKQFRARVAGLGATISAEPPKVDKGKGKERVVKQEPAGITGTPVAGWTAPEAVISAEPPSDPSSSTSRLPVQSTERESMKSKRRPLTLKLPAMRAVGPGTSEAKPRVTTTVAAVSDDYMSDDEEEPLSVTVARKRSMTALSETAVPVPPTPDPPKTVGSVITLPQPVVSVPVLPEPTLTTLPPSEQETLVTASPEQVALTVPHPENVVPTPLPPLLTHSPEEQKPILPIRPRIRLILHPPRPPPPESSEGDDESSSEESSSSSSSRSGAASPLTLEALQRRALLVWDSDESELTPIEDLTDMGESEVDQSESEDEVPPTPKDIDLAPQAPWSPPPKPPLKHRGICSVVRCMNLLPENTRLKFCHTCAARKRVLLRYRRHTGEVAQDTVEDEGMVIKMPPDGDLTGFRNCNKKHCKRLIPPEANYRWKTCPPCRVDSRNRARLRRAAPLDLPEEGDDDDEEDIPLASIRALRKLASRAKEAAAPAPLATHNPKPLGNSGEGKQLPVVPAYQHFAALLTTFRARFTEFVVAQAYYLRFKARQDPASLAKARRNPIVFRFDGEYSIVADPSGGLVDAIVQCAVRNVQAALGLEFSPVAVNAGPESSVIAVLRCMYGDQVPLQQSSPKADANGDGEHPADASVPDKLSVRMVGELQVYVAWDRRHPLFPGQRVIVRFRLVG
ncbi:uncharacterized protein TRAVEDRAFT_61214 [Trametes versicolor FP-101664 SS1]|uniref:uncharacterized protein n=1 Tax=Trametes versicolor (strain FP-101664) TaxID=717944 RepID=UPI00046238E6|nr:uncharacterized protein TRAVEDRAFT_61214 [Trametes versicolor FP-101664 SS1]EIW53006.1 hypothetical protein TRAVEDRAFT_61214 [Trametes versicolor FP-101664 SS1]